MSAAHARDRSRQYGALGRLSGRCYAETRKSGRSRMIDRRTFLAASAGAALAPIATATAETADQFPSRPIRLIVPQAAGSGVDLQARLFAQKLGEMWGRQMRLQV